MSEPVVDSMGGPVAQGPPRRGERCSTRSSAPSSSISGGERAAPGGRRSPRRRRSTPTCRRPSGCRAARRAGRPGGRSCASSRLRGRDLPAGRRRPRTVRGLALERNDQRTPTRRRSPRSRHAATASSAWPSASRRCATWRRAAREQIADAAASRRAVGGGDRWWSRPGEVAGPAVDGGPRPDRAVRRPARSRRASAARGAHDASAHRSPTRRPTRPARGLPRQGRGERLLRGSVARAACTARPRDLLWSAPCDVRRGPPARAALHRAVNARFAAGAQEGRS